MDAKNEVEFQRRKKAIDKIFAKIEKMDFDEVATMSDLLGDKEIVGWEDEFTIIHEIRFRCISHGIELKFIGSKKNNTLNSISDFERKFKKKKMKKSSDIDLNLLNLELERKKWLQDGMNLSDNRKEEIKKELDKMSQDEVNNEIRGLLNAFIEGINNINIMDIEYLEDIIVIAQEGKYVTQIYNNIDQKLKEEYVNFIKKCELGIEFLKQYERIGPVYLDFRLFDTMYDYNSLEEYKIKQKEEKNKEKQYNKYSPKYIKLHKIALKLYMEGNEEYKKYTEQLDELKKQMNI